MTEQERFNRATNAMEAQVDAAIKAAGHAKNRVIYSAYPTRNDVPVNNLGWVAARGRVRVLSDRTEFYGGPGSRSYCSHPVSNPTWLQVAVIANEAIRTTRDRHHVFLEGLHKLPKKRQTDPEATLYELVMGS